MPPGTIPINFSILLFFEALYQVRVPPLQILGAPVKRTVKFSFTPSTLESENNPMFRLALGQVCQVVFFPSVRLKDF
jgi:hypothetical protein